MKKKPVPKKKAAPKRRRTVQAATSKARRKAPEDRKSVSTIALDTAELGNGTVCSAGAGQGLDAATIEKIEKRLGNDLHRIVKLAEQSESALSVLNEVLKIRKVHVDCLQGFIDRIQVNSGKKFLSSLKLKIQQQIEETETLMNKPKSKESSVGSRGMYRKASERPFPQLPSSDERNYERKQIKARLEPDVVSRISEFARAAGKHREVCIQEAIEEYLANRMP